MWDEHSYEVDSAHPPLFDLFAVNHRPSELIMVKSWAKIVWDYTSPFFHNLYLRTVGVGCRCHWPQGTGMEW